MLLMQGIQDVIFVLQENIQKQKLLVVLIVLKELFQMKEQHLALLVHLEKLQKKDLLIVMINKGNNNFII